MLAKLHQAAEEVLVVGDVEISSQDEISCGVCKSSNCETCKDLIKLAEFEQLRLQYTRIHAPCTLKDHAAMLQYAAICINNMPLLNHVESASLNRHAHRHTHTQHTHTHIYIYIKYLDKYEYNI